MTDRVQRLERLVRLGRGIYRRRLAELGRIRTEQADVRDALTAANRTLNSDENGRFVELVSAKSVRLGTDLAELGRAAQAQVEEASRSLAKLQALRNRLEREEMLQRREEEDRASHEANERVSRTMAARLPQA